MNYQLYYEVQCLSYRKNNVFFVPSYSVFFVLFENLEPIISYSTKTSYDLDELKNQEDYIKIVNIIKNFEKNGTVIFDRDYGKIVKQNISHSDPCNVRRFLLLLIGELNSIVDGTVTIVTNSFFSKIWLTNFRLLSSNQIINKHRVLSNEILITNELFRDIWFMKVSNSVSCKMIDFKGTLSPLATHKIINIMRICEIL